MAWAGCTWVTLAARWLRLAGLGRTGRVLRIGHAGCTLVTSGLGWLLASRVSPGLAARWLVRARLIGVALGWRKVVDNSG